MSGNGAGGVDKSAQQEDNEGMSNQDRGVEEIMSIQIGSMVKLKDGAKGLYEQSHYIGATGAVIAAGDPAKNEWEWFVQFDADTTLGSDSDGLELVEAC